MLIMKECELLVPIDLRLRWLLKDLTYLLRQQIPDITSITMISQSFIINLIVKPYLCSEYPVCVSDIN